MLGENMVAREGLDIDAALVDFVEQEVLPGLSVTGTTFWAGLAELVQTMTPQNRALLAHRDALQSQIDGWHRTRRGQPHDAAAYKRFLIDIGYLQPDGDPFTIDTPNVDAEIATIAGPQVVVPVTNARFALNAANARWGSLFDALYGTDALGSLPASGPYDAERGAQVVRWAKRFLNDNVALDGVSHCAVDGYRIVNGALVGFVADRTYPLLRPEAFVGFQGTGAKPTSVLLVHRGLHIELVLDRAHTIGSTDRAGLADVQLESAVTTIMDFEDSVSTVDAADKIVAYRNWLGLMKGTLAEPVRKNGEMFTRRFEPNRTFRAPGGISFEQAARSLLLARNVGIHITTPALRDGSGDDVFEGLLDAMMTITIALHDRLRPAADRNSREQSIYIVKPKLHGPDEVAFAVATLAKVETLLGLPENTVKIGIMDEERRTTVNLHECIRQARSRVAFINTGFLDRTGDEIHTSMEAGPMVPKAQMKTQPWISAYENRNVDVGLACGFSGRAQIGKGMWAAPDLMGDMLHQKAAHPMAGANCAWVPSPTAATLHAIHYHQLDVFDRQATLRSRTRASVDDILTIPIATAVTLSAEERQRELDNNLQGILGYVVRWVDQGVGCSKVPDINNVALMEDRATCRISSQHVANWLRHGVISEQEVHESLRRMAVVVDGQNAGDPLYLPMSPVFDGPAFLAASELVFDGCQQPSGYTELILHHRRQQAKTHLRGTVSGHDGSDGVAR
jgi:malate synthase